MSAVSRVGTSLLLVDWGIEDDTPKCFENSVYSLGANHYSASFLSQVLNEILLKAFLALCDFVSAHFFESVDPRSFRYFHSSPGGRRKVPRVEGEEGRCSPLYIWDIRLNVCQGGDGMEFTLEIV